MMAANKKFSVPGVAVEIMRAQVICQYVSYGGNGEHDEYFWTVNGEPRDQAFVRHLLDMEENPAMQEHARGLSEDQLAKRY
ncbi:hypothetical protein [Caballeronia sp. dw_276]|uniref:hypothetical protein n=1 Tax=Caballeronia sp. dw_276 TaxID=2719795 RepID=UPI001BD3F222|nr:hypothetical protein [Caballeronia sp. dw_276]